jgi:AAHS family 3-hydroxyphenylpropionic acid transporter
MMDNMQNCRRQWRTLATMVAGDYASLLAARLATGVGLGVAMPVLIAIALEVSQPAQRSRTVTAMFCGMPVDAAARGAG